MIDLSSMKRRPQSSPAGCIGSQHRLLTDHNNRLKCTSPFETTKVLKNVDADVCCLQQRYAKFKESNLVKDQEYLRQLQSQITTMKKTLIEIKAGENSSHSEEVAQKIRILENRLDKALIRHKEAAAFHEELRESIEGSQREWFAYRNTLTRIEKEMQQKQEQVALIVQQTVETNRARDAIQTRFLQMESKTAKEREKLSSLLEELDSKVKENREYKKERPSDLSEERFSLLESDDEQFGPTETSSSSTGKNVTEAVIIEQDLKLPSTSTTVVMRTRALHDQVPGAEQSELGEEAKFRQIENELCKLNPILMSTFEKLRLKFNRPLDENHFSEAISLLEDALSSILKRSKDWNEDVDPYRFNDKSWTMAIAELPSLDLIEDKDAHSDDDSIVSLCEPIVISDIIKTIKSPIPAKSYPEIAAQSD